MLSWQRVKGFKPRRLQEVQPQVDVGLGVNGLAGGRWDSKTVRQ
jgi:hypothetical protein